MRHLVLRPYRPVTTADKKALHYEQKHRAHAYLVDRLHGPVRPYDPHWFIASPSIKTSGAAHDKRVATTTPTSTKPSHMQTAECGQAGEDIQRLQQAINRMKADLAQMGSCLHNLSTTLDDITRSAESNPNKRKRFVGEEQAQQGSEAQEQDQVWSEAQEQDQVEGLAGLAEPEELPHVDTAIASAPEEWVPNAKEADLDWDKPQYWTDNVKKIGNGLRLPV